MVTAGAAQYTYDGRGNLQSITNGSTVSTYAFDARNQMTSATVGGSTTTYTYDAAGRRVQQQVSGGQTTNYLWDEMSAHGDVSLETDGNGAPLASYVLGNNRLISQNRGGTVSYYLPDAQGSIRNLTSATGSITDSYAYDAFGVTQNHTGTTVNPYQYTGQQFDSLTGLYDLRARYYDPAGGNFLSRDTFAASLQRPMQFDRYLYTGDNPVNRFDPSGHEALTETGIVDEEEIAVDSAALSAYQAWATSLSATELLSQLLPPAVAITLGWIIFNDYPGEPEQNPTPPEDQQQDPNQGRKPRPETQTKPEPDGSPNRQPPPPPDNGRGTVVVLSAGGTGTHYTNAPENFSAPVSQLAAVIRRFPDSNIISVDLGAGGVADYLSGKNINPITEDIAKLYGGDLTVPEGSQSHLTEVRSSYDNFSFGGLVDVVISFYPQEPTENSVADTAARILRPGGAFYAIASEEGVRDNIASRLQSNNFTGVIENSAVWSIIHGGTNPLGLKGFISVQNYAFPTKKAYDVYATRR